MLEDFFSPNAVAVVGASCETGKVGYDVLKNMVTYGYAGKVYPVNPKADNILGIKTYPSLREINDTVDLAVIVLPAHQVRAGETLYSIARRYGLKVDELRQLNKLAPGAGLHPGDKLVVNGGKNT